MGAVLIYDTETAAMVVSPRLPEGLGCGYQAAVAVGEKELYLLESEWSSPHARRQYGGLHCLSAADHNPGAGKDDDEKELVWGWRRPLSPSSPWRWNDKLVLPFLTEVNGIGAHAVVNRDVLVSVNEWPYPGGAPVATTFSFDTATWQWTRRGDWGMPVVGHAHYDGEMDAWVGLHVAGDIGDTDGRLCTGDLTAAPWPEWNVGKEKLFRVDELDAAAGWRHVSAKLVPMAPGKYCLMERLQPEGDDNDDKAGEEWLGDGDKRLLRLTAFRVERGEDGEPVATALRPARSYRVSRYNKDFDAQAFWM